MVLTRTLECLKENLEIINISENYDNIRLCKISNTIDKEKLQVAKLNK